MAKGKGPCPTLFLVPHRTSQNCTSKYFSTAWCCLIFPTHDPPETPVIELEDKWPAPSFTLAITCELTKRTLREHYLMAIHTAMASGKSLPTESSDIQLSMQKPNFHIKSKGNLRSALNTWQLIKQGMQGLHLKIKTIRPWLVWLSG